MRVPKSIPMPIGAKRFRLEPISISEITKILGFPPDQPGAHADSDGKVNHIWRFTIQNGVPKHAKFGSHTHDIYDWKGSEAYSVFHSRGAVVGLKKLFGDRCVDDSLPLGYPTIVSEKKWWKKRKQEFLGTPGQYWIAKIPENGATRFQVSKPNGFHLLRVRVSTDGESWKKDNWSQNIHKYWAGELKYKDNTFISNAPNVEVIEDYLTHLNVSYRDRILAGLAHQPVQFNNPEDIIKNANLVLEALKTQVSFQPITTDEIEKWVTEKPFSTKLKQQVKPLVTPALD